MNIADIALDRAAASTPDKRAVRVVDANFGVDDFTYGALQRRANQFANALKSRGVGRGAVVASLLGHCPELFVTVFGTLKVGAIFSPLFCAFGPEPIRSRLEIAGASVLVTTARLYERKVAALRASLPALSHVFIVNDAGMEQHQDTVDFNAAVDAEREEFTTLALNPDDDALLHFTSGTTGKPKGVVHAHRAVIAHYATGRMALDLHEQDVFWCTADPGWVTGFSYGVIAPLACGVTMIVDREKMDVEPWYELLAREQVSVWYTAPTAIRMLMRAGLDPVRRHRYPALRHIASVGEPLNPEAVQWGVEAFGLPIHDTWWQTETGAIMIANFIESRFGRVPWVAFPGVESRLRDARATASSCYPMAKSARSCSRRVGRRCSRCT